MKINGYFVILFFLFSLFIFSTICMKVIIRDQISNIYSLNASYIDEKQIALTAK